MDKTPYAERVRLLAEKMAKESGPKSGVSLFDAIKHARIAVAEMQEMFNNGWSCGVLHANNNEGYDRNSCLTRLGLIPDTEQEQFNPEKEAKTISVTSSMFKQPDQEAGPDA